MQTPTKKSPCPLPQLGKVKKTVHPTVLEEMQEFASSFESLSERYQLVNKIGEGTFSSVYKAIDLQYHLYDNSSWDTSEYENESDSDEEQYEVLDMSGKRKRVEKPTIQHNFPVKFVALKRIYVTSSPQRIMNEISILNDLNGSTAVISLITAFRQEDQVVAVQPYFSHDDFRLYYRNLTMEEIKCYFRSMFTALKHIHAKKIIHRDVKPSNFLYNVKRRKGVLVDFGLAQREDPEPKAVALWAHQTSQGNLPAASLGRRNHGALDEKENRSEIGNVVAGHKMPGFLKNDMRPFVRAYRAGTRGFRAPEVLFRVTRQTVSIDIWSAGVVLLSFLSGSFPFFNSFDDVDALLEIACLFGYNEMRECAALHNRTFQTNVPSIVDKRRPFHKLCAALNGDEHKAREGPDMTNAFDLLDQCLTLDPRARITAEKALEHPFLAQAQGAAETTL